MMSCRAGGQLQMSATDAVQWGAPQQCGTCSSGVNQPSWACFRAAAISLTNCDVRTAARSLRFIFACKGLRLFARGLPPDAVPPDAVRLGVFDILGVFEALLTTLIIDFPDTDSGAPSRNPSRPGLGEPAASSPAGRDEPGDTSISEGSTPSSQSRCGTTEEEAAGDAALFLRSRCGVDGPRPSRCGVDGPRRCFDGLLLLVVDGVSVAVAAVGGLVDFRDRLGPVGPCSLMRPALLFLLGILQHVRAGHPANCSARLRSSLTAAA